MYVIVWMGGCEKGWKILKDACIDKMFTLVFIFVVECTSYSSGNLRSLLKMKRISMNRKNILKYYGQIVKFNLLIKYPEQSSYAG